MRHRKIRTLSLILAILSLLAMPTSALTEASEYIHYYNIYVYTSGRVVETEFSIDGTKRMSKLGASAIDIYEYPYGSDDLVSSKRENYAGMIDTGVFTYTHTISYTGKYGKDYKVVVTVFAEDSEGSDSRTKTYYVST